MQPTRRHRKSYNEAGHAHELTFGCFHGHPFLARDRTCQWLADSIRQACEELEYSLWAYVFMPNHVHLVVHPAKTGYEIAEFLKRVKHPVSRKALACLRREAPAWLDRVKLQRGRRPEYHFWQRG